MQFRSNETGCLARPIVLGDLHAPEVVPNCRVTWRIRRGGVCQAANLISIIHFNMATPRPTKELFRDALGFEFLVGEAFVYHLGCRTLVPHARANHQRDFGRFRLVHRLERGLRGIRDLMLYVESFIH